MGQESGMGIDHKAGLKRRNAGGTAVTPSNLSQVRPGGAVWLGIVPRQDFSGGKPRLLGSASAEDGCLRKTNLCANKPVLPRKYP
jgi:hypothetical protein